MGLIMPTELPKPENIKLFYRFASLFDESGNGYTLTNENTVSFTTTGKIGYCADFGTSNTNKRLVNTGSASIAAGSSVTALMWVKIRTEPSGSAYYTITQFCAPNNNVIYWVRYYISSGTKYLNVVRTRYGVADDAISKAYTLGTSSFHQVGLQWDNGGTLYMIYDGSRVDNVAASGNGTITANGIIFGANGTPSDFASIYLDEFIIWDTLLTTDELTTVYNLSSYTYPNNCKFKGAKDLKKSRLY